MNPANITTFYSVILMIAAITLVVSATNGQTLTNTGLLTIGTAIPMASGNLKNESVGMVKCMGTFMINGHFTNNGTFDPDNGTMRFRRQSLQRIRGSQQTA